MAVDASAILLILFALAFGYLCGSVPFGLLLTRGAGIGDVRAIGSGSIGATNVLRTGRKDLAAATVILDALKGAGAVLLSGAVGGENAALAAGLGAFGGHIFPVWLNFRGGKGIATFIGVLVALAWPVAVVFALVWLAVAAVTRYSSAAGLAATALSPVATAFFAKGRIVAGVAAMAVVVFWTHRANIARLRAGTESRIGAKSDAIRT